MGRITAALATGRALLNRPQAETEEGTHGPSATSAHEIDAAIETAQHMIEELTRLMRYISLNMTAIRKVRQWIKSCCFWVM